jgi:protein O-GlcNAc transferase
MFNWFKNTPTVSNNPAPVKSAEVADEYTACRKRGNEHLAQGRLEEAAECYRQAIAVNPGYAEGLLNLGFVSRELGRYEDAERYLQQAVRADPALADAYYLLGGMAQARGNPDAAIGHFNKTLELKPDFEMAYGDLCQILFQNGQIEGARKVIQQGLSLFPQSALFHCYLGNLYVAEKKREQAIACYRKALTIQPDDAEVLVLLGNIHKDQGELDDALGCYRRALALRPDSAEVNNNLGSVFHAMSNFGEAVNYYQRALLLKPDSAEINSNLGAVFQDQGNLDKAEACYRNALALDPEYADAHNKLGTLFHDRDDLDEAQACYRKALALEPDSTDALNNLGVAFQAMGNFDEAAAYYRKALALKPDSADANLNLGILFSKQGNLIEAESCYRKAITLRPDFPETYNHLGNALRDQGKPDEAAACYSQALMLKPDFFMAHYNLGVVFQEQNKLDKSLDCYRHAVELSPEFHIAKINLLYVLQLTCDWKDIKKLGEEVRRSVREISPDTENQITPFSFLTVPGGTPEEQKRCATNWAQGRYQSLVSRQKEMGFVFKQEAKPKLHIGYFSADFRTHPVAQLMAEVFETHDRERFRITAYSFGPNDGGDMRKRLEKTFDSFVDISDFTHEDAARKIYEDRVDILVDLMGYTRHNRSPILALRPAPIQVNYLGYPGTMGAGFIDYLIADRFIITPEHQKYYTEKVKCLPDSYLPRDSSCRRLPPPGRKDCGLPDEGFVFCSFNPFYKITPDVFDVWCRLLIAVPESVLWLSSGNPIAESNLRREAENRGVNPERIIRAPRMSSIEDHLARVQCADLFLDTTPYNAHTTCSDALWMGLPVITCTGETFPSRVAGGLLTALGVPELITYSLEDYYALALELATDKDKYAGIRNRIIANRESASLFNSTKFTRDLENIYRQMWDEYVNPRMSAN